jgi:RHS repeat-associated protein
MGRLNQSWTCTSDTCYASPRYLAYTYNYLGQVQTTAAAGGTFTLSNVYNATGELTGITSSLVDQTHPRTLFTGGPYNALGELEAATYGDGTIRSITYDHRGRATIIRDSTTYALYLGYTGNSSVSSANDSVNGDWSFTYDAFNRLAASSNASSGAAYTYGYDQVGNRWRQDRTAGIGLTVDLNFDLTTNRVTGSSYAYDAGGNMTSDGSCSNPCWAYDKMGNLISGEGATYAYDAFNQRVQKTKGGTTYDFVMGLNGQPFDEYQGTTHTRTTAGFVTYANNTTYFNHTDHLGAPRITTDYTGTVQRTQVNLPFGDGFVETPLTPILDFTGYAGGTSDSENNADHFGAREHDKTPGRWFSPDPAGLDAVDPSNPQTWNRYTYSLNNPMTFFDRSGLDPWAGKGCGSATLEGPGDCGQTDVLGSSGTCVPNSDGNCTIKVDVNGGNPPSNPGTPQKSDAGVSPQLQGEGTGWLKSLGVVLGAVRLSAAQARRIWEAATGQKVPFDAARGRFYDMAHIDALVDGGTNAAENLKPQQHDEHIAEHMANGDFARWASNVRSTVENGAQDLGDAIREGARDTADAIGEAASEIAQNPSEAVRDAATTVGEAVGSGEVPLP